MSIFYPDNDKRQARLLELSADAHVFLKESKDLFARFKTLSGQVNEKIAALYRQIGLTPPTTTSIGILKAAGAAGELDTANTVVAVSTLLVDVGAAGAAMYFAPAATALLVDAGVLEAEAAGAVLVSVLGAEITVGTLAGGIIGAVVAGVIAVGIGLAFDAIEGAVLRDHLRKGIHEMDQVRVSTRFALDRCKAVVSMLEAVGTGLDSIARQPGIKLTEQMIENAVQKDAIPAIKAINSLDRARMTAELQALDRQRGSWTQEDLAGRDLTLPKSQPIYVNVSIPVPLAQLPPVPAGLKPASLSDPDTLVPTSGYPVLQVKDASYWPFSFIDNREAMAIVAYDRSNRMLKRWDKSGARYIWKIEQDPATNEVLFVGQARSAVRMKWSELTAL